MRFGYWSPGSCWCHELIKNKSEWRHMKSFTAGKFSWLPTMEMFCSGGIRGRQRARHCHQLCRVSSFLWEYIYLTRWSSASQHLSVMITPLFSDSLHRFLRFVIYQIEKNVWFLLRLLYKNLVFSNLEARRLFSWKHAPVKPWQQWIEVFFRKLQSVGDAKTNSGASAPKYYGHWAHVLWVFDRNCCRCWKNA